MTRADEGGVCWLADAAWVRVRVRGRVRVRIWT